MKNLTGREYPSNVPFRPPGRLGFGCGMLLSAANRSAGIRLLEAAFDSGIVYFDTARLYAEGHAEGMLGEALGHRRDQITVVSKAGILPTYGSLARRLVDKAIHVSIKVAPMLPAPRIAQPTFGVFDIPRLRKSVDRSLRELRTDYLDALLLHECTADNAADPEIKAFAEDLLKQGKIRAYGVAPTVAEARAIEARDIEFGTTMQIASSACETDISGGWERPGRLLVTHSVLGARFRDARKRFRHSDEAVGRWRTALDIDPKDGEALARLFLAYALHANASGIVLFSTTDPARIRSNLHVAKTPMPADQARVFADLLRTL